MIDVSASSSQKTILVVEDNQALRAAFQDILQAAGYRVISASDGREALDLFHGQNTKVNLLISDIHMPEMNGFTLAERLRQTDPEIKVLMMSGQRPEEADDVPASIPIDGWLQKPIGLRDFTRSVNELLRGPA